MRTMLKTDEVLMQFGGLTAVNKVSIEVLEGQIFSVIGPNGAGKTTLFNAITGIYTPTAGRVTFEGHRLTKPLTAKVIALALAIGAFAGMLLFLLAVNVDLLWRATIKRPALVATPSDPFAWSKTFSSALGYLGNAIVVEPKNDGKWLVVPADRSDASAAEPLLVVETRDGAERAASVLDGFRARADSLEIQPSADGKDWLLRGGDDALIVGKTQTEAQTTRAGLQSAVERASSRQRVGSLALVVGFLVGFAGYLTVWNRSRRTTDTIAMGGIARTFQNIRLFQNMTVRENILIGMNRSIRGNFISQLFRLPVARREDAAACARASELLTFVGLEGQEGRLAKNLPYGNQRRLEIARALACGPKLLLLDEPAAGMNPSETVDLMGLIRLIRDRGITILLIEHHMSLVMGISDRIAVLDYGIKIAEGAPLEVRNDPRVIEAYLGKEEVS